MSEAQGLFLQQNAADTLLRNTSSLQVLLSMGFPKERAYVWFIIVFLLYYVVP